MVREARRMGDEGETGDNAEVVVAIGKQIRRLRNENRLTLQELSLRTDLSVSMLSLLERGKTGPSLGTLITISTALGANLTDLINAVEDDDILTKHDQQSSFEIAAGVQRRVIRDDRQRGIKITLNEFAGGTTCSSEPQIHQGFEYGLVLEGDVWVELDDEWHQLEVGDIISYDAKLPHRVLNPGTNTARALWINFWKA